MKNKVIETKIYRGIINKLYEKQTNGIYLGDAHNFAQELSKLVSIELLSKQQRLIFDNLPDETKEGCSCKELSIKTNIDSKNISSQLRQMMDKTLLIGFISEGKNKKYYKYK